MMAEAIGLVTKDFAIMDTRKYATHVLPRLQEIKKWVQDGATEYSIAEQLDICYQTWINYKKSQTELIDAITRARTERAKLVKNKQFAKACGMTITLNKQKVTKDGDVIAITEDVYIPPDTNAAEFWARHEDPDYVAPKAAGGVTLVQNNFQLPQLEADLLQIQSRRKELETLLAVDVEVIEG
jgi:hypothetical protein